MNVYSKRYCPEASGIVGEKGKHYSLVKYLLSTYLLSSGLCPVGTALNSDRQILVGMAFAYQKGRDIEK